MFQSPALRDDFSELPALPALAGAGILALLFFLAPTQFNSFPPSDFDFWPQSLWALCLAFCAVFLSISRLQSPPLSPTAWWVCAFVGWNFLAALAAPSQHDAWLELARIVGAVAVFFLARTLPHRARWALVIALILGLCWPAFSAFLDFLGTRDARQFGPFNNPNYFAAALGAVLPFALVFALAIWRKTNNRASTLVAALPALVLLLGLAATGSKGGFVATLFAILVLVCALKIARPKQFQTALRKSLFLLLLSALVMGAIAAKTVGPRLLQVRGNDDNSTQFRVFLWRGTLEMARNAPIFGQGPGSFVTVYPRFAPAGIAKTAHQSWLQIAAESGYPALFLWVGATLSAFLAARKTLREPQFLLPLGSLGALAALFAHGCFDSGWSTLLVPVVWALALGLCEPAPLAKRREERGLNLQFSGLALVLGVAGHGSRIAAQSYDLMELSISQTRQGLPSSALQSAREAVEIEPGNARAWSNLAIIQSRGGDQNSFSSLQTAIRLQPARATNYAILAALWATTNPREADRFYAQALQHDPNNTQLLLERARFRLDSKSGDGFADLRRILALWDAPLGRFPALSEWVNLDFVRALILAWPQLSDMEKTNLRAKARADLARAQTFQKQNQQILDAIGRSQALQSNKDLPDLLAALSSLPLDPKSRKK